MKTASIVLLSCLLGLGLLCAGCSLFQTETQGQYKGVDLFVDNITAKATPSPVDAKGQPNPPLVFAKAGPVVTGIQMAADSQAGTPWGIIAGILGSGGVLSGALNLYLKMKNRKSDALLREYVESVENIPEAAKAVEEKAYHSAALQAKVADVTAAMPDVVPIVAAKA